MSQSKIISAPNQREIDEIAALWVVRADEGLSAEQTLELKAWLIKSEHHRTAFERLSGQWGGLNNLASLSDLAASDDVRNAMGAEAANRLLVFKRPVVAGSLAALAAVFLFGVFLSALITGPAETSFHRIYQTEIGQQETIRLPDGSSLIMNTASVAEVNFDQERRHIQLVQGEGYFDIAPDKEKPFIVETSKGSVTAIGTAFSVRVDAGEMEVVVTEGRVALEALSAEDPQLAPPDGKVAAELVQVVAAGHAASVTTNSQAIEPLAADAIEDELDWRDGILAFNGESLESVVADISRYTDLVINIEDENLRAQPIGGYFKIGEIEALFDALKLLADVEYEYTGDRHVRLYRLQ